MQLDEWYMFQFFPTQRGNLKLLTIATPHQSFLPIGSEVPIGKKSSFPSGEAKKEKTIRFQHSPSRSIPSVFWRASRPYQLAHPE